MLDRMRPLICACEKQAIFIVVGKPLDICTQRALRIRAKCFGEADVFESNLGE
jgi:diphthamide biosynthesis methyltransferase